MHHIQDSTATIAKPLIVPNGQLLILEGAAGTGKTYLTDKLAALSPNVHVIRAPNSVDTPSKTAPTNHAQLEALLADADLLAKTILILDTDLFSEHTQTSQPPTSVLSSKYSELLHAKTAMTILETRLATIQLPKLAPNRRVEFCWFRMNANQLTTSPSATHRTDQVNNIIKTLPRGQFLYQPSEGTPIKAILLEAIYKLITP